MKTASSVRQKKVRPPPLNLVPFKNDVTLRELLDVSPSNKLDFTFEKEAPMIKATDLEKIKSFKAKPEFPKSKKQEIIGDLKVHKEKRKYRKKSETSQTTEVSSTEIIP